MKLTTTNIPQECHFKGIRKLYDDVGFDVSFYDVLLDIVSKQSTIYYDEAHPEDFWIIKMYFDPYWAETIIDLYAVIKQSDTPGSFIHKSVPILTQLARDNDITRFVFHSYPNGFVNAVKKHNPWGWKQYQTIGDSVSYFLKL